jgi:cyclophilin family peptidyl-prolyl cis-trans isomerase
MATLRPSFHQTRPRFAAVPPRKAPGALRGAAQAPLLTLLALSALCVLPGAASAQSGTALSPAAPTVAASPVKAVRVTTSMGAFVIELQADRAPLTVQNFVRYVSEGFYTNTLFHRVVGNFVAQGGGHDAATLKLKPTHEYIVNESGNGLQNKRGTVGMARSGGAHTANSQFYVNLADNTELDPLPTRWGYTVFGRVTEGMEVLDKMGVVATGSMGELKSDAPLKAIVIEKVEALGAAPVAAPTPTPPPASAPAPVPPESTPPPPPPAAEAPPPR